MAELMAVKLNLASRWLLVRMLNQVTKSDPETGRKIRDIRKVFELKQAKKEHRKMVRDRELEIFLATKAAEKEDEAFKAAEAKGEEYKFDESIEIPTSVDWDDLIETPVRKFTIDDSYITWLRETLEKAEWDKIKTLDSNGRLTVMDTLVVASMQEAIADLADALLNAVNGRGKDAPAKALPEKSESEAE